jgi:hypothetical protein
MGGTHPINEDKNRQTPENQTITLGPKFEAMTSGLTVYDQKALSVVHALKSAKIHVSF